MKLYLVVLLIAILTACQGKPEVVQPKKVSSSSSRYQPLTVQNVKKVAILLINTRWNITTINQQPVQAFNAQPYIYLMPQNNQLMGSTGCNQLSGNYRVQATSIEIDARAGHEYCPNALAQEADLIDQLARVRQYQMGLNTLKLLDAQGRVVIVAVAQ